MAKLAWRVAPMLVDDHPIGLGGDVPLDTFTEQKAGDEPLEELTFSLLDIDTQVLRADFACHGHLAARPSFRRHPGQRVSCSAIAIGKIPPSGASTISRFPPMHDA